MTYLIAEIWTFIVAGSVVGLLFGWMFRGGVSAARLRELRRKLAHAEAEAADQRREAAELAARAERRASGGTAVDAVRTQRELREATERNARLQAELREAQTATERYEEEAEELRTRLADASGRGVGGDEDGLASRIAELESALDARDRQLESEVEAAAALRARVAELEAGAFSAAGEAQDVDLEEASRAIREAQELRARNDELRRRLENHGQAAQELDAARERLEALQAELAAARERRPEGAEGGAPPDELKVESERLKWRNGYLTSRIHFLENKLKGAGRSTLGAPDAAAFAPADEDEALAAAREEIRQLRARVAELEQTADGDRSGDPAPNVDGGHGSLEWRNRYLASRVRYLEQQLESQSVGGDGDAAAQLHTRLSEAEQAASEADKLRRRVAELERTAAAAASADTTAKSESEYALEWRNRYLSSRVKYLEDRLAKAGLTPQATEA